MDGVSVDDLQTLGEIIRRCREDERLRRWVSSNLHRLPLPGPQRYRDWLGILGNLKTIGVDDADAWSTQPPLYPAGDAASRWEGLNWDETPRHAYNTVARQLVGHGAEGQPGAPGSGIDPSIQCSYDEITWAAENYSAAICNDKNRIDLALVFHRLGVSVDDIVAWVAGKMGLNNAGSDRFSAELTSALPPDMSERKAHQGASRWLKDAGIGAQPERPKHRSARQQAKENADPITAMEQPSTHVGWAAVFLLFTWRTR